MNMTNIPTDESVAVVMGGSVAGMLSAVALLKSGHDVKVIILDKDDEPVDVGPLRGRAGTPQDQHIHFVLEGGRVLIEDLVPGFTERMIKLGARPRDRTEDCHWFRNGNWKVQYENGTKLLFGSRMMIDRAIRTLMLEQHKDRVEIRWESRIKGLKFTKDDYDVCGVEMADGSSIDTKLVVDCLGRVSPVDKWLMVAGYNAPEVDSVNIDLCYTTQIFKFKPEDANRYSDGVFCYPDPDSKRGGGHMRVNKEAVPEGLAEEGYEYSVVTLFGFQEEKPKCKTNEEFMAYAKHLNIPELFDVLSLGTPIYDAPKPFAFPDIRWKRYDKLAVLPRGLVMLGDSVCRLDPTHAQGMTSAARQATILKDVCGKVLDSEAPYTNIHKDLSWAVQLPFLMNAIDGNKFSKTTGYKPPMVGAALWFLEKAFDAADKEPKVFSSILSVANLESSPLKLLRPDVLYKILRA